MASSATIIGLESHAVYNTAFAPLERGAIPIATGGSPVALTGGQDFEAAQLNSLSLEKNTIVFRPTLAETESAAFKVIVGDAKYTRGGLLKGTIFDSVDGGLLEIKGGASELTSSYQLRLQTYYSLKNGMPFTIRTARPVNPEFRAWLQRWGVNVEGTSP